MRGRPGPYLSSILKEQKSHYDARTIPARRRRCPFQIAVALIDCLPIVASRSARHCLPLSTPGGPGQLRSHPNLPLPSAGSPSAESLSGVLCKQGRVNKGRSSFTEFMREKANILPRCDVVFIFQAGFLECLSPNCLLLSPPRHFPFLSFPLFI